MEGGKGETEEKKKKKKTLKTDLHYFSVVI